LEAVPELAFRRYHANQWVERAGHWLPPAAWQEITGMPKFKDGEPIWVGVDVGGDKSASAVVWINGAYQVGVEIYHGDEGVLDCVDKIRELAGTYQLREVMYDPGASARRRRSSNANASPPPRSRKQTCG
jgi:hypothetical protein